MRLACPYCGSHILGAGWSFDKHAGDEWGGDWCFIICRSCAARGPSYRTEKEAWDGWNMRNAKDKPVAEQVIVRRDGYKFCEKHQQEFLQHCSGCSVDAHLLSKEMHDKLQQHLKLCKKNLKSDRVKCCAKCPFEDIIIAEDETLAPLFLAKREFVSSRKV